MERSGESRQREHERISGCIRQGAHRHIKQKYGKYGNFDSLNMRGIWEVLAKFSYKIWEIWEGFFTTLDTLLYISRQLSVHFSL